MFWLWMTISCGIVEMAVIDIFDICIYVMFRQLFRSEGEGEGKGGGMIGVIDMVMVI